MMCDMLSLPRQPQHLADECTIFDKQFLHVAFGRVVATRPLHGNFGAAHGKWHGDLVSGLPNGTTPSSRTCYRFAFTASRLEGALGPVNLVGFTLRACKLVRYAANWNSQGKDSKNCF